MIARTIHHIQADWIRIPLLCLHFPFGFLDFALHMLLFHPERHRLRELDLWMVPIAVFWAAWDGDLCNPVDN